MKYSYISAVSILVISALTLSGCKKEDIGAACDQAKYPELADPIKRGQTDGQTFITSETAAGKAAGEALTRENGLTEGRAKLYDIVYAEFVKKGIDETYGTAYNQGVADQASYSQGQTEGTNKGIADGKAKAFANGKKTG